MTEEEYDICARNYASRLLRFALKYVWDIPEAEDFAQETLALLWTEREKIRYETVDSYLFASLYHKILNSRKRQKIHHKAVRENYTDHVHAKEYLGIKEALDEALKQIPDDEKAALLLKDMEGQTFKEISVVMRIPEREAIYLVSKARIAVKKYLVRIDNLI